MIETMVSFLGGAAFRALWSEVAGAWRSYQDHRHEIAMLEITARMDAQRHAQNLEMVRVQAEMGVRTIEVQGEADVARGEADAFVEAVRATGRRTGTAATDAWNAAIRPALATVCMLLWIAHVARSDWLLDDRGWMLLGAALGVYVADRTLAKMGRA
jgi:hypothetical protein